MPDSTWKRLANEVSALKSESLYRHLEVMPQNNFCSNDYLGISQKPELANAILGAISSGTPIGSTGSRLLSGHHEVWETLEAEFALWLGSEAALFFGSGYAANVGLLSAILQEKDTVFSDSQNHASLIDGIRLSPAQKIIFPHLDLDFLESALKDKSRSTGERFIVVESIFSMDGDQTPITDLCELADRYQANVIVDEAHATGVLGPSGRGVVAEAGNADAIFARIHTCGKALASSGAFVAGSMHLKEFLINRARTFLFSTALPPYMAIQISTALRLAEAASSERLHLESLGNRLRKKLRNGGFDYGNSQSHIVPVFLGTNETAVRVGQELTDKGFAVRAVRPPTVPDGTSRLRLSLNSMISEQESDGLVDALSSLQIQIK